MTVVRQPIHECLPPNASPCGASTPTSTRRPAGASWVSTSRSRGAASTSEPIPSATRSTTTLPTTRTPTRCASTRFPPDGEFAGSDPDLASQAADHGGRRGHRDPRTRGVSRPRPRGQLRRCASALNHWQANHWLDSHNNWHERWRGSICVAHRGAGGRGARDREVGRARVHVADPDQGRTAPVVGRPEVRPDLGGGHQARHPGQLPPVPRPLRELPIPPVGLPSYNHDFMVTYSLLAANQVMSLIFDGTFDRHPDLEDRVRRARVHAGSCR